MNKKSLLWLFPMLLLLACHDGHAENSYLPWDMKTPFKESATSCEIKSMNTTEISTVYEKEYGKLQAMHRWLEKAGQNVETMRLITDQDWVYYYDLQRQQGYKNTKLIKVMYEAYNKLSADERKRISKKI